MACVADVGKDPCFNEAIAGGPAQAERGFKMNGGPVKVAEMMIDVTEGVPRVLFGVALVELGDECQ